MGWAWICLLGTLGAVAAAGSRLPGARNPLTAGLGAAFLFLINPVVLLFIFPSPFSSAGTSLLFAAVFVAAGLWMQHWSGFMRSVILAFLFGIGLWLGARSVFWSALALVPWVLFHRRPWLASASMAWIVLGGSLMYAVTRGVVAALMLHSVNGFLYPWFEASLWLQSLWPAMADFSRQNGPAISHHLAGHLDRVTLGWSVLAFSIIGRRLQGMIVQRRSDIPSFMSCLATIAFGVSLGDMQPAAANDALAVFVAITAPLVAYELSARDYLYNRSARISAGIGIVCGALAIAEVGWSLWGSMIGILVAGVLTLVLPATRKLLHRVRWRAILVGCSVGASVAAGVQMYFRFFI